MTNVRHNLPFLFFWDNWHLNKICNYQYCSDVKFLSGLGNFFRHVREFLVCRNSEKDKGNVVKCGILKICPASPKLYSNYFFELYSNYFLKSDRANMTKC